MSPRTKTQERIFTVFFMFAITLVFISAVTALHLTTRDLVERNKSLYLNRAVLEAAGTEVPESPGAVVEKYKSMVTRIGAHRDMDYYRIASPDSQQVQGYAFTMFGPGLWGRITAVVGLDADLRAVTGVSFVDHNETPGLGARISEEWFQTQFAGKTGPFRLVPEETQSASPEEIDAITGATITSTAVRDIMNRTLELAPELVAKGEG